MTDEVNEMSAASRGYGKPRSIPLIEQLWKAAHLADTHPETRTLLLQAAGEIATLMISDIEARAIKTATVYLQPDDALPGIAEDKAILTKLIQRLWL
jgi:hypothetical protein